ncbi:MAG: anaerobic ribonucleoside-triphosphate reductase activating protein [Clostridiales bacterium]|nr:anaerobic ribonucleoside-triphosphate reductase activating protein [Clostridiales bacterium]
MQIGGMQRLSLLDYPDRTCCTIFTVGCNYRCPFCHNASLALGEPSGPGLSEEQILAFLKRRQGLLDGVCITGGEPLLQQGLEGFIDQIKALGFSVKLDTNGSYPERLRQLIDSGRVDYVAMDVKNTPDKYGRTIGVDNPDLTPVRDSISLLLSGAVPCEFRTTVVRELHTVEDLLAIARWIRGAPRYYLQNYVDSDDVLVGGLSGYSREELQALLDLVRPTLPGAALRGV